MTWPLDRKVLGAPDYGVRPRTEQVVIHTTEGTDSSLAAGIATAKWQATPSNTSGGSYHFIMTDEGPILTVPYMHIAGSVSTNRDPAIWQPERFPWMKEILSDAAYSDVNKYAFAISVSGKTSRLKTYPHIGRIIDDTARLIRWAERQPDIKDNLMVSGHFMWQTNRSDPSQWFIDEVMDRYAIITGGTQPVPTPGDDTVLIMKIVDVLPDRTIGKFVPQAAGSPYLLLVPQANGALVQERWNPTDVRNHRLAALVSINGGQPMLYIDTGTHAGKLVDLKGPQPQVIPPAPVDCAAAVTAALEPYKRRLSEFSVLASKPLETP